MITLLRLMQENFNKKTFIILGPNHLLHRYISGSFAFSRWLNGTFFEGNILLKAMHGNLTLKRRFVFVTVLIWVTVLTELFLSWNWSIMALTKLRNSVYVLMETRHQRSKCLGSLSVEVWGKNFQRGKKNHHYTSKCLKWLKARRL